MAGDADAIQRGSCPLPVAAGDRIYAVSERGEVHVFAAADKHQPLAVNRIPEPCLSTPAIA